MLWLYILTMQDMTLGYYGQYKVFQLREKKKLDSLKCRYPSRYRRWTCESEAEKQGKCKNKCTTVWKKFLVSSSNYLYLFLTCDFVFSSGNFSDSGYNNDTHTLQVGYELAMKERDAAIRENSRIADDLNDARRKVDALQAERNRLVNNLENLSSRLDKPTNP